MRPILTYIFTLISFYLFSQGGYTIENYDININIAENGTCTIEEKLDVRFQEKRRGIIRTVPLNGKFRGHEQKISITDIEVIDWKFASKKTKNEVAIKIGDPNVYLTGNQFYNIKYTASNGILNYENHEEIYWTLIGPDWDADILNASFTIKLPKAVSLKDNDLQLFSGKIGQSTSYGKITQSDSRTIEGNSLVTLGKAKGLTIGLRLPKGYFFAAQKMTKQTDSRVRKTKSFIDSNPIFPAPLLFLGGLIGAFLAWGRRKKIPFLAKSRYFPPTDMSPSEVGYFYDFKTNDRDIIALIPKWGQEGIVNVKVLGKKDVYLEKINEISLNAPSHEIYFFNQLFSDNNLVFVDNLKYTFYGHFANSKSLLTKDIDPGLYDKSALQNFHGSKSMVFGMLSIAIGILFFVALNQVFTGLAFVGLGIAFFIIRSLEPKKSERGIRTHNELSNLYQTLINPDDSELSSIMRDDPQYLEKIFPYVVAFGIEEEWTKHFEDLSIPAPSWYNYADGRSFWYRDFHRDFNTKTISKTIATPPAASSGSSSFGGGGSVGGGFGGGGGSSW